MKDSFGPRLVSFKGMLAPVQNVNRGGLGLPLLLLAFAQSASLLWQHGPEMIGLIQKATANIYTSIASEYLSATVAAIASAIIFLLAMWRMFWNSGPSPIYLVDFACFKPADECKMTNEVFLALSAKSGLFTEKSMDFQQKILASSGLGPETYVPPSMHSQPPDLTICTSMKEAEMALFTTVGDLLKRTGVKAQDIGILVVNCSTFCPIPSMSAMVVNHFKMRESIESYHLGGMGCSAGVIAVSLAQDLLKVHKNTYAIVLSTEMISGMQGYKGNYRSMMVGNCIFRWGASAVLLSNKRGDRRVAKYSLVELVRTHKAADDKSFQCVKNTEDADGIIGVSLSRELIHEAGNALKANITTLAPKILPLSEKLKFASNFVARKILKKSQKPYVPDFQKAINHFCIHPGGKAVLDGIEKNLQLSKQHMEPSRMTLHRFGNTSSSSIWYVLAYMEAKHRVRKNDLIWQIALGSGLKCNSAVWKSLRNDQFDASANPWADCVKNYPVSLTPSTSEPK